MDNKKKYKHTKLEPRLNKESEVVFVENITENSSGLSQKKCYYFERTDTDTLTLREMYNGHDSNKSPINDTPVIHDEGVILYLLSQEMCEVVKDGKGNIAGEFKLNN